MNKKRMLWSLGFSKNMIKNHRKTVDLIINSFDLLDDYLKDANWDIEILSFLAGLSGVPLALFHKYEYIGGYKMHGLFFDTAMGGC